MTTPRASLELNDLRMSHRTLPLLEKVQRHVRERCDPAFEQFDRLGKARTDRSSYAAGQLELIEALKSAAKAEGLWNLFLPNAETGEGLRNIDYAYIAFEIGKNPLAAQSMNCNAPDTGNMEVLERVGTAEQKERWLKPLLDGTIRSAFAMTEPGVASSDARNISTRAELRDGYWIINGEKFFVSAAGDPRCKVLIVMAKTSPGAAPFRQQSQILVPMDTPGVEVVGNMHVFGQDDAPYGPVHLRFTDVRVPEANVLWGEGKGFEISQVRLGPGRIHHCMRSIGAAETALDLMTLRGTTRSAFGKKIIDLGKNMETISRARIEIEAMRLVVLKAAKAMDVLGNREARIWVSMAKAMVPERVCRIIDEAIQIHGAAGLSEWTPLANLYIRQRALRIADGPDEVHHQVIARNEVGLLEQALQAG